MPRTGFSATQHGFHFRNVFVNRVATIPGYGDVTTSGRCGGMAFAALDYYFLGMPIPLERTEDFPRDGVPPDGHPLADYIYQRLMDSFLVPSSMNFVTWSMQADHSTWFYKGVWRWTREDELPRIQQAIDAGGPVPVGLVSARNVGDIGRNHQVVAYGYDVNPWSGETQLYIYDNNYRDEEVVFIISADPGPVTTSTGESWRGLFLEGYSPQTPTYQSKNKEKEKEKEKEKDTKEKEKDTKENEKNIKEKDREKVMKEREARGPAESFYDPMSLASRIEGFEGRLARLEDQMASGQAFIRPEERPDEDPSAAGDTDQTPTDPRSDP